MRADWVGGDAAYGNSPALRQMPQTSGQAYVLAVGPGRGRHRAQLLPAQVPASAWRCYTYRMGREGPLRREAVLVPVWRWEADQQRAQARQLLISRELDGSRLKYSLCYTPQRRRPC